MGWFKRLNEPVAVEERVPAKPVSPLAIGITGLISSDLLAGEDTSLLDRAAFVAYPFAIAAAATAGATSGARDYDESEALHQELEHYGESDA